ncbi:MAG: tetratricopeptide repeat protein [Saprospiraceae bacterium]|nr:tetratricopeptide repeat protein [Saprospiraceae bacterium]
MRNLLAILLLSISTLLSAQQMNPGILIAPNNSSVHANAIKFYSGQIERNPSDVKSILLRSELYKALNMREEANADIDLAMAINPYSYLYMNKAERNKFFARRNYSYFDLKDMTNDISFEKSYILLDEYNRLMDGNHVPSKTKSLFELALIALDKKDFDVAEKMLSAVSSIDNNLPLYHDIKGIIYLENGDAEKAIQSFTKAIQADSLFTIAFHNRAVAYKMLGDYEAAENDFNTALSQRVDMAKVAFSKAKLLELKGDIAGARYFYQSAISRQVDYPEARLNYTVMLKAAGEYTRALIEINELIKEYPDNVENYYVRAGLHFIYGEYANAVDDFDTYLFSNPNDVDVLFYRGLCLVMDGNVTRGCQDINVSIENGYDNYDDIYLFMCE